MTGVPAIEVEDVFRVYATAEGHVAALRGLGLRVAPGEVVTVLGPSGSGKTTLLRILGGFDRPSAGTVRVLGADLARLSRRALTELRARDLAYADQRYGRALAPELTAREIIALPLVLGGEERRPARRRADELLDRIGLLGRGTARPRELSGGEQQRVALAAALVRRPRVLLADEPTGELDAASAAAAYELIGELVRELGCAGVVVSHDPESASIADRVVQVRDGRISSERAPASAGEEALVVDRGWLRLPDDLVREAGIDARATPRLVGSEIVVAPAAPFAPRPRSEEAVDGGAEERRDEVAAVVDSVSKVYGNGVRALSGLSAALPAGRLIAVTGPSGSGKTTLLHLLCGLEVPTEGEVTVLGNALSRLDRTQRALFRRARLALVTQDTSLLPRLSARENVELSLSFRGVASGPAARRAEETLGALGLARFGAQQVMRLSAGERQRVAVARAAAALPELLLVDEPTARLDEANAAAVAELLARLSAEAGTTVVVATHDPLVVERADEELVLGAAGTKAAS